MLINSLAVDCGMRKVGQTCRDAVESTWTSPPPDFSTKRCQICSALCPDDLECDGDEVPFHDSFAALEAAAKSGCELCTVLFWNIQSSIEQARAFEPVR